MNKYHALGRLVAKPELKTVGGDKKVVNFRIAVDRKFKRGNETAKETAFIPCEAWDTGAELIAKHFDKGELIIVHGSFKQEEWEDKNGGGKRSQLKLRVESFDFVPGAGKKADEGKADGKPAGGGKKAAPADDDDAGGPTAGEGGGESEIPF